MFLFIEICTSLQYSFKDNWYPEEQRVLIKERNGKLYMVYFAEIMLKLRGGRRSFLWLLVSSKLLLMKHSAKSVVIMYLIN